MHVTRLHYVLHAETSTMLTISSYSCASSAENAGRKFIIILIRQTQSRRLTHCLSASSLLDSTTAAYYRRPRRDAATATRLSFTLKAFNMMPPSSVPVIGFTGALLPFFDQACAYPLASVG